MRWTDMLVILGLFVFLGWIVLQFKGCGEKQNERMHIERMGYIKQGYVPDGWGKWKRP